MKLYFYLIVDDKNAPLGVTRKVIECEAKETATRYTSTTDFPGSYSSIIPKDIIGKAHNRRHGGNLSYDVEYRVILTERNDTLACQLLKECVESVIENLQKKADRQRDIVGAICAPLRLLKEREGLI